MPDTEDLEFKKSDFDFPGTERVLKQIAEDFVEEFGVKPSESATVEPDDPEVKRYWEEKSGQPYGPPEKPTPPTIWSFGFEAEDLLAVYAALRVYLRTLAGQESEDLEMLGRVVRLMNHIRPAAVKASKALSLKEVGMK